MVTLGQHLLNDAGIDLVIMDIEGAEVHALRGMSEIMPRIRYFTPNSAHNILRSWVSV